MRPFWLGILGVVAVSVLPSVSQGGFASRLYVDYDEKYTMVAGAPADWVVEIFDPASVDPVHHFHVMHEKEVHLITVSEDLQSFAHFHPVALGSHTGLFGIRVNDPLSSVTEGPQAVDPDSLDATRAVLRPGRYFLFSEAMPMGSSMVTLPMDLEATGARPKSLAALVLDPVEADGSVVKQVDGLRIKIKFDATIECTNTLILSVAGLLEEQIPNSSGYKPVEDLQPWLGAYAHAILVSEKGSKASEKKMLHLHTVWPLADDPTGPRGPDFELGLDQHGGVTFEDGVYRVWFQFKRAGQVITIPLNIQLKISPVRRC